MSSSTDFPQTLKASLRNCKPTVNKLEVDPFFNRPVVFLVTWPMNGNETEGDLGDLTAFGV